MASSSQSLPRPIMAEQPEDQGRASVGLADLLNRSAAITMVSGSRGSEAGVCMAERDGTQGGFARLGRLRLTRW